MKNIKTFDVFESTTDSYAPPKFAIKPAKNDKVYDTVRKSYNRMMWTKPELGNGGKIDKGEHDNTNESDAFNRFQGEIQGMGMGDAFPGETVGYTGPLKDGGFMTTDDYMDPDKLNKLLHYDDFESEESEDDKEEDEIKIKSNQK